MSKEVILFHIGEDEIVTALVYYVKARYNRDILEEGKHYKKEVIRARVTKDRGIFLIVV